MRWNTALMCKEFTSCARCGLETQSTIGYFVYVGGIGDVFQPVCEKCRKTDLPGTWERGEKN